MSVSSGSVVSTTLAARILDAFPSGSYALLGLLRLIDIVESHDIDTAAVECRAQPRMLVNPRFVDRWAATSEKLLMLIMHELHHVLLGHTRLLRRTTSIDNLVFDAVINALLCRMFPQPEYTAFFTDFYDERKLPECLLRPPRGWHPTRPIVAPLALKGPERVELRAVYRALYSPVGVGYQELHTALRNVVDERQASSVVLVGDHAEHGDGDSSSCGRLEEASPVLFEAVREIVERWPQPPDPIAGRSLADLINESNIRPLRQPSNRATLRELLRRIGGNGRGRAHHERQSAPLEVFGPLPTADRRGTVLRALGHPPLLYPFTLPQPRMLRAGDRVHVYVDVSSSIGDYKQALCGAVLDCRGLVLPMIHQFSTRVVDVSLDALRRGEIHSTGGTAIDCVAAHMREHRVQRAVLITDGYVGTPRGADQESLGRARVGVALTPDVSTRDDLREVVDAWAQLHPTGGNR
jgi:hypothetical protein